MAVSQDGNASGGQYLLGAANSGLASYEFQVPKNGTYFMWAHHFSDSSAHNSFFLSIDEPKNPQGDNTLAWDALLEPQPRELGEVAENDGVGQYSAEWLWVRVFERVDGSFNFLKIREFELTTGNHTMYLAGREQQSKVDAFYLTDIFSEQPVFPDEAPGFMPVEAKDKLAATWASVKSGY